MKLRFSIIMMVLVIVPTGLLSFLAARSLEHGELASTARMEDNANNMIVKVNDEVNARLIALIEDIRFEFSPIFHGPRYEGQLDELANQLEEVNPLVEKIYITQRPWAEFSFPKSQDPRGSRGIHNARLLDEFQATVTFGGRRKARVSRMGATAMLAPQISLKVNNYYYFFVLDQVTKDNYVGFRVRGSALNRLIEDIIKRTAGSGMIISVEGPGANLSTAETEDFGSPTHFLGKKSEMQSSAGLGGLLAQGTLPKPFEEFVIRVADKNPYVRMRGVAQSKQLFMWSIILLASGIIGGVWLAVRGAYVDLRRIKSGADFVVGISHDFRTPLASMKMLAESVYLGHVQDPEKRNIFIGTIVCECDRLSQLIERVLVFVRFGQGSLRYMMKEADVGIAVCKTVDTFLSRYPQGKTPGGDQGPTLELNVDETLPTVMLDTGIFDQVILNLLDNAECYGRKGMKRASGAPAWIGVSVSRVRCRRKPWTLKCDWVRISVSDKGDGISAREQKKIFQKYYRARGSRSRNVSGVGLGLSVCRGAATAHSGWIEVESTMGEGSAFHFYLPAQS